MACEQTAPSTSSKRSPAAVANAQGFACTKPVELDAFACSGGTATRSGDTLHLLLDGTRDTVITTKRGELSYDYQYVGRIGRDAFQLVEQFGGEHPPYFFIINPRTGRSIEVPGMPVIAPDGARFAAAIPEWDCAESPDQRLEIWRFTDSIPVLEWRLEHLKCEGNGRTSGWAAVEPVWRGRDTIAFTRLEGSPQRRRQGIGVRDARGWRLASSP